MLGSVTECLATDARPLYFSCLMFFFTLLLFGGIQARIVALNGHYFLKNGGHFVLSIKVHMLDLSHTSEANLEIMFLFLIF